MLVTALPLPIAQSVCYPAYAERFPTRVRYTGMTIAGLHDDYQQANLVIVQQTQADAQLLFCLRNPKTCPILAVGDAGDPRMQLPGAPIDIRTMLPRYRSAFLPRPSLSLPSRVGRGWLVGEARAEGCRGMGERAYAGVV